VTFLVDAFSWLFLLSGAVFCVIGAAGLIRFPDFFSRAHAAGITDTMGASLILAGLILQAGPTLVGAKLAMILVFIYLTSPAIGHGVAKSALVHGVEMAVVESEDDFSGDGDVVSH